MKCRFCVEERPAGEEFDEICDVCADEFLAANSNYCAECPKIGPLRALICLSCIRSHARFNRETIRDMSE